MRFYKIDFIYRAIANRINKIIQDYKEDRCLLFEFQLLRIESLWLHEHARIITVPLEIFSESMNSQSVNILRTVILIFLSDSIVKQSCSIVESPQRQCFLTFPNTEKRVENTTRSGIFLMKFEVFGNADETQSRVFDISSQSKQKLRSKRRNKIVGIYAN